MERYLTETEVTEWLKKLRDAIPKGSESIKPNTLNIWAERLVGIPPEVLAAAALVMKDRLKFFPALSEILEACREITLEGKIPTAPEAYEELTTAMRLVGYYKPCPDFSHPAIKCAVAGIGGWKYLCSSENNVSDRARFFEIYGKIREEAHRKETMPEFSKQVAAKYLAKIEANAKKKVLPAQLKPKIVPIGVKRKTEKEKPIKKSSYEVGANMTEEEWEARKKERKRKIGVKV